MDPEKLWKEAAKRAATSKATLGTGGISLFLSGFLVNPLPLILWGVGAVMWVGHAAGSKKHHNSILDEEKRAEQHRAREGQDRLRTRVVSLCSQWPFARWVERREIPDYVATLEQIERIAERIIRTARDRQEVDASLETEVNTAIATLLPAYFTFLETRLVYLQILTGAFIPERSTSGRRPWQRLLDALYTTSEDEEETSPRAAMQEAPPCNIDATIEAVRGRLEVVRSRSEDDPAKEERTGHADILGMRIRNLEEIKARDARASAQLDALPDVFTFMLERLSAAKVDRTEITSFMRGVVQQVEETGQFVEAMRPNANELLDSLRLGRFVAA